MSSLIIVVISGIIFSYFATLNTQGVTVHMGTYSAEGIPLYLVVLISLLLGLFLGAINNFFQSIITGFKMNAKDKKISEKKQTIAELTKHIHELEIENARLTSPTEEKPADPLAI